MNPDFRRTTVRRKEKNGHKKSTASSVAIPIEDSPAKQKQLKVYIEGPFGAPASDIFRAEHAVLIATGIGVTPFSSILQSIMHQYKQVNKKKCLCLCIWAGFVFNIVFMHHG